MQLAPIDWLRLTLIPGIGDKAVTQLLTAFGSPEAVLACGRSTLATYLSAKQIDALQAGPDATLLAQTEEWLSQPKHSLLTLADPDYPRLPARNRRRPAAFVLHGTARIVESRVSRHSGQP